MAVSQQSIMESLILQILKDEPDTLGLGDGNLELMVESIIDGALKSLVEKGEIKETLPHFYQLSKAADDGR